MNKNIFLSLPCDFGVEANLIIKVWGLVMHDAPPFL